MFFKKKKKEESKEIIVKDKGASIYDMLVCLDDDKNKRFDEQKAIQRAFPRTVDNIVKVDTRGRRIATDSCCGASFNIDVPNILWRIIDDYFIGFQACALLKQNAFIDKACTIPVKDALASDYKITLSNDDESIDEQKLVEIKKNSDIKYNIKNTLEKYVINKKVFGYGLAVPLIDDADYSNPYNIDGIKKGSYRGITIIEPQWVSPLLDYDSANNPLSKHYLEPTWYQLPNGKKIHRSWVLRCVNSEVPDVLKPAYYFGGIPLTQQIYERVYCANKVANEAPQLALTKRMLVADANVSQLVANPKGVASVIQAITNARDNYGIFFKNPQDTVQQLDTSLGDFDALIMTQYQLVASIAGMPAVKLLKTQPKGFNATGEYEERDYKQSLIDIQNLDFIPLLRRHLELLTKSEYGEVLDLDVVFNPIDTPTEKEVAEIDKIKSETAQAYINMGAISPEEEREILRNDPDGRYTSLSEETPLTNEEKEMFGDIEKQNGQDEEPIDWITVNGNHIPIMKGESKKDAINEFLEKKEKKSEKSEKKTKSGSNILDNDKIKRNVESLKKGKESFLKENKNKQEEYEKELSDYQKITKDFNDKIKDIESKISKIKETKENLKNTDEKILKAKKERDEKLSKIRPDDLQKKKEIYAEYKGIVEKVEKDFLEKENYKTLLENLEKLKKEKKKEIGNIKEPTKPFLFDISKIDEKIKEYDSIKEKQNKYDEDFIENVSKDKNEALKQYSKSYEIQNFHQNPKLTFEAMPLDYFDKVDNVIHQSVYYEMGMQFKGSAYGLVYEDGKLYYVRKSDHFGDFSTTHKDLFEKYPQFKKFDEETMREIEKIEGYEKGTMTQTRKNHKWDLVGNIEKDNDGFSVGRVLVKDFNKEE